MNRWVTQRAASICVGVMVAGSAGCISSGTYDQAQRNAELKLLNEQRFTQELSNSNRQMKQRIEELESSVRNLREQLARTDKDWRDVRDEILRMKIEKEQGARGRDRFSHMGSSSADVERLKDRTEEAMRRMKDLMRQIQSAIDQLSGKEPL